MLKLDNEHEKNIIELYASLIQPGGKIEIPSANSSSHFGMFHNTKR